MKTFYFMNCLILYKIIYYSTKSNKTNVIYRIHTLNNVVGIQLNEISLLVYIPKYIIA